MKCNNIITLENNEKYLTLNEVTYNKEHYFLVMGVDEEKNIIPGKVNIFKEINKDNEIYIEIIKERKKDTTFITITGDIVENPLVIETKIGTPLKEIIKENITLKSEDYTLILNGLLKGREASLEEVIIISIIYLLEIKK